MDHAIGMRLKKADSQSSVLSSHFFGSAKISFEEMFFELYETEFFLCQIDLAALAAADPSVDLPHSGYLYVFLQMSEGSNYPSARAFYYNGTPDYLMPDYNGEVEGYEHLTEPWEVEFYHVAPDAACTRLLGDYTVNPFKRDHPRLFLQLDLDELNALGVGLFPDRSGYLCIYFGEDDAPLENLYARFLNREEPTQPQEA